MDPEVKAMKKILLLNAKLAQEDGLHEEMYTYMNEIVELTDPSTDLSPKERSLLGAALRNMHSRWKARLSAFSLNHLRRNKLGSDSAYFHRTKQEISKECTEILNLIDNRLLPSAKSPESNVFYLTLKGDFSWYCAEVKGPIDGKGDASNALNAYFDAQCDMLTLDDRNSSRLALNLSMAEHSYKYLNEPERASEIVDLALSAALRIPMKRIAPPLLTFEGGIRLIANLEHLKKEIETSKNKKRKNEAGPSNVQPTK